MPKSSGSCRTSENSESTGALNSNQPRRPSVVTKPSNLTELSFHSDSPAVWSNPTLSATGMSQPRSRRRQHCDSSYANPRCVSRKSCGSAEASVRGATPQRAHAPQASSMGVTEAAVTSPLHSLRVRDEASFGRTSTTTSSLTAETLSPIYVRLSSAASAARSTRQQAQLHSIAVPASRVARKADLSTVSSNSDMPVPPPGPSAADAALTPCLMPVTSDAPSEHRADTELELLPTKGPLPGTVHEKKQSMCDAANSGVVRLSHSRTSDPVQPAAKPMVATVTRSGGAREEGGASGIRTEVTLSPSSLLGGDPARNPEYYHCVIDPAPQINVRKQRSRATQKCCAVEGLESADGEPVRELPSPVPARSSSQSLTERLFLATSAGELCSLSVSSHAPLQLMVDPSSASQTPRRLTNEAEARDCGVSAVEGSRLNESSLKASSSSEAVSTALGASLPVAPSSSQVNASVTLGTPVHMAQPVSAFMPQMPESDPTPPHTPWPSAGADGPLSFTSSCLAVVDGSAEAPASMLQQRHRASSGTLQMDLVLEHCLSSESRSPSVVENAHSTAPAHAPPPKRGTSGAFSEATATAPTPRRSSSLSSSLLTTAVPLSASEVRVHDTIEAEAAVGRGASMPLPPQLIPELHTVDSSDASTASERSLCAPCRGSSSKPLGSFAALPENSQDLRQREEEKSHTGMLLDNDHASNLALEGHPLRNRAETMSEPEDEEPGVVMCSADETDRHPVETEDEEVMKSSSGEPICDTDATDDAPITSCLRRKDLESQREPVKLRTLVKRHHPAIMDVHDSIETVMGGVEQTETVKDGPDDRGRDTACDAVDGEETSAAIKSPKQRLPSVTASSHTSPTTSMTRVNRARPEGCPPVRYAGGVAAPIPERSGTTESAGLQCNPSTFAASPPVLKARETNQPVSLSSLRTNGLENGTAGTSSVVNISIPGGRVAREEGSRARFARALSCGALGGAVAPRATTTLNSQVTPVAAGAGSSGRESRRRSSLPTITACGGAEQLTRVASRRGDGTSGSLRCSGPSPSHHVAMMASDKLLPPLFSEQEAANTITIVFDLDETLCNNRYPTGTILRPGAELLLRTLRGICPSPRYKLVDPQIRSQHASNRLYDEAMCRMGVTPLYRSRVAHRQSVNGYHHSNSTVIAGTAATSDAGASGVDNETSAGDLCSTGEARPATTKDTNPLRLELVLWTASEETLARRAMCHIDPMCKIFDEAIYRDPRWYRDSYYTKDLSRLGRCMERVVIVENSIDSVARNRKNAILVTSFVRNRLDRQLFLVREVLRDWVRSMKVKLGDQQCAARAASALRESTKVTAALDIQPRTVKDTGGSRVANSEEEGGESPVPPHSTSSPTGDGRSERVPASTDEVGTHTRRGNPVRDDLRGEVALRGVTPRVAVPVPCQPSAPAVSVPGSPLRAATKPLSAMVRRAPNIVEFLKHHRLIFPDSNFLRFQLTGEVMMLLQATEATLITAALSQTLIIFEQADARVMRSVGHGSPRTAQAACTPVSAPLSFTAPATAISATAACPEGSVPRASHSGGTGRASSSGVPASINRAKAAAARPRASVNETAAVQASAAAGTLASSMEVRGARTTRNSSTSSSRYGGVARGADAHRDPVRLQRSASAAPKRPATNPS